MIKTLQISSILAVILAAVLFVSSIVFGTAHEDEQIEEYLKSPSVKEQFETMGSAAKKRNKSQSSPLVEKAEQFAGILNPPKPKPKPKVATKADKEPVIPRPDVPVKPKFRLFGTVVCESDPQMSLALLDEPGKGLLMVRQGADIMHLTIEQVKDGRIVVRDATGTSEMVVEEGPAPASIVPGPPTVPSIGKRPPFSPTVSKTGVPAPPRANIPPRSSSNGRRGPATAASIRARMTAEENARLAALGDRLKAAKDAKAGEVAEKTEAEEDAEAAEMIKKLMTDSIKEEAANKAANPPRPPTKRPPPPQPRR